MCQLNMIIRPRRYIIILISQDVDLTFKKGDHIKLLKKTNNGWWYGELDGQTGYFPHNFV